MKVLGRWQQVLRQAVACLALFILVALYLAYYAGPRQRQRPTALDDSTQHLAMPLLGMLDSNASSPTNTTMDCHDDGWRQFLKPARKAATRAEAAGVTRDRRHEWQPAVSAGETLHECTVGKGRKHVAQNRFQGV